MTEPQEPRDSGAMLSADGNLYPDPEGYTPSIVMILIACKCQEQGVSASPWQVEQAFEEYKAEHGRFPKPEDDFAGAVRQWLEANPGVTGPAT